MSIPILHHNFDATGLEMFYKNPFYLLSIIILFILFVILLLIMFWSFKLILKLKDENKISPLLFLVSTFLTPLVLGCIMLIGGSFIIEAPKLFSSEEDGRKILKPIESVDNLPKDGILSELGLIRKYSEDNTLVSRYNDYFVKEMKNNDKMEEYTIPECELNDSESIICGGNYLTSVKANKGDKKVTLTPHVEIDSDKAEIDVDNPNDKGVQVYYWIEET